MSPSALREAHEENGNHVKSAPSEISVDTSCLLDRDLNKAPREVEGSNGSWIHLRGGQKVFDSSCGAAVSCLGHQNEEVATAVLDQMRINSYCHSLFFKTDPPNQLSRLLIEGTDDKMAKAFLCSSGTEACEAAIKMAIQYHIEVDASKPRYHFITRLNSYHGTSLGALGIGGHLARRAIYEPLMSQNVSYVSECNPYRQREGNESDESFVARKAFELEQAFINSEGPVAAFFMEPVSGAALGCVPYVKGYMAAMKAVCSKYGALFVLDEVMSGMGRCGTLHAWQAEHSDTPGGDCVPDIQMIGKGLGGGFQPIAGIIINHKVVKAVADGSGSFKHGQTYQAHPTACAAAHAVQTIIQRENLIANVQKQGIYLESLLHSKLDNHPNVGNVRGLGLFWGVEFVSDKKTKEPFDPQLNVAGLCHNLGLTPKYSMSFYPGQGSVDGVRGDHILVAPAYVITREEIELIATTMAAVIEEVFDTLREAGHC